MDLMKKRWAVLVASVIVNICIGTGFAWSVYQTGLFNEGAVIFGTEVQKSQLALAFTICSGVAPIPMIAGNGLQKKLKGPRNVVWLGGILFSAGLICTSFIHSLTMLYVTYGTVFPGQAGIDCRHIHGCLRGRQHHFPAYYAVPDWFRRRHVYLPGAGNFVWCYDNHSCLFHNRTS